MTQWYNNGTDDPSVWDYARMEKCAAGEQYVIPFVRVVQMDDGSCVATCEFQHDDLSVGSWNTLAAAKSGVERWWEAFGG